jgi:hypothetical protein
MPTREPLPDLLERTSEVCGEEVIYRFANGLSIKTEAFNKPDKLRILPLGSPQGSLMNHMVHFPDVVRGKRVFEPFAGSGALGFMALKVGAHHVDLISELVVRRPVELTPSQNRPIGFEAYCHAYSQLFPDAQEELARWRSTLLEKHGEDQTLCYYIARVGGRTDRPTCCVIQDDFAEKFGESFLVPSDNEAEFSIGRVFENFVTSSKPR